MKKGSLNFLGRKNQSLFDTNIKVQEMDNVELVLDSSAISESGTAKVKSRPTVKHFTSSFDSVQGFAVPTPTVPVLHTFNGPKINGAVNADRLSIGSAKSVPNLLGGEMFIPPPPSMAPPPPPQVVIRPPTEFLGNLESIQPPPMTPPKPPSKPQSTALPKEESVYSTLKPPSMQPPKPPSTSSSSSSSRFPISQPPPTTVPHFAEPPKFAPPLPPTDLRQAALKALKTPPAKPVRMSSIPSLDEPPHIPVPAPPGKNMTPSSFNPQNTAKIYSVPNTSNQGKQVDNENRSRQILPLHDPESVDIPVQVNGQAPSATLPVKPARSKSMDTQIDIKENLQDAISGQASLPKKREEVRVEPLSFSTEQHANAPSPTPPKESPKLQNVRSAPVPTEASQIKHVEAPAQIRNYSPLLDRKLRHLRAGEVTGTRDGPAASPLALLQAAKERDKHRSAMPHENNMNSNEPSAGIQHTESKPNSFTVVPTSTSFTSQDKSWSGASLDPRSVIQAPTKPSAESVVSQGVPTTSSYRSMDKQNGQQSFLSPSSIVRKEPNSEDQCMPLLPPPPEFDDFHHDSPPSSHPPDPPMKKVLPQTFSLALSVPPPPPSSAVSDKSPPPPPPPPTVKPKYPSPPKVPPPVMEVKPKLPVQTKPKPPPTQVPSSLSASQATLLSILQKKMLEMDNKMENKRSPMKETDTDDWGSPLSDEETKVTVGPRVTQKFPVIKSTNPVAKTQGLDMKELENKMSMKAQSLSASSKSLTSNGPQSKQASGLTFTVRPGTKQPITVVSKGDTS